jgi:CspA family cold shock protein
VKYEYLSTGRVRWFNDHFGYGFITNEYGEDVFVHYSTIEAEGEEGKKSLNENEVVSYAYTRDNKRLKTTKVVRAKKKG